MRNSQNMSLLMFELKLLFDRLSLKDLWGFLIIFLIYYIYICVCVCLCVLHII